jgi:Ni,Fe-hydrogenase III small subunit/NAD-dependent dihydropyrimidine dehydrogenase PreA subunit
MLSALRVKQSQGRQYILDVRRAQPLGFKGLPSIADEPCAEGCNRCRNVCPSAAIDLEPVRIDLGKCVFCTECVDVCPVDKLGFSSEPKFAAGQREQLIVRAGTAEPPAVEVAAALRQRFGRSLKLRSVSAGGCNGCELELNAMTNVNFDVGRFGIDWVASPRHADALVLSGPLTRNMAEAVELAYAGMPEPRFVIAFGACAISGGLYATSPALDRAFFERFIPSLYVPGCPPHPLTFINGLLDLLGIDLPNRPGWRRSGR